MKRAAILLSLLVLFVPLIMALENYGFDYNNTIPRNYVDPNVVLPFERDDSRDRGTVGEALGSIGTTSVSGGVFFAADPKRKNRAAGNVSTIAFSPDSSRFVTAQSEDELKIWEILSPGEFDNTRTMKHKGVFSAVYSWDGEHIGSVGLNKEGRIWNASRGRLRRRLKGEFPFSGIAFSKDNTQVITGETQNLAHLRYWTVANGNLLRSVNVDAFQTSQISVSRANGDIVHSFPGGHTRILLRGSAGDLKRNLTGHSVGPLARFSVNGDFIVGISNHDDITDQLIVWRSSGARMRMLSFPGESVRGGDVSPDGRYLFAVTNSDASRATLRVYNMSNGRLLNSLALAIDVNDIAVSPDGLYVGVVGRYTLAQGNTEGRIFVFPVNTIAR